MPNFSVKVEILRFLLNLVVFTSKNVKWYEVVWLDMIYTKFDGLKPIIYLSKTLMKDLIKKL